MSNPGDWRRVSKAERCPACNRGDWCLVTGPEGNPNAAICPRTESPKRIGEAGWLHVLRDDGPAWPNWRRTIRRAVRMMTEPDTSAIDFSKLAAEAQAAVKPEALGRLARSLGLSVESLRRLAVGWLARRQAWGFPMRNAVGRIIGIRLRLADGRKLSVRDGREGLFLPEGIDPGGRLLIAEGPTDCAALLDLGFPAVGRPSCTGGVRHLIELVKRLQPDEIIIVGDADAPGRRGAAKLAATLTAYCPAVRVIAPPDRVKDARQWRQAGATAADVLAVIGAAPVRRVTITTEKKGRKRCQTKTATA